MKQCQVKLNRLDRELNYLPPRRRVDITSSVITNIQQRKILPKSPSSLGFLPDSLDITIDKVGDKDRAREANNLLNNFRSFLSREYGV